MEYSYLLMYLLTVKQACGAGHYEMSQIRMKRCISGLLSPLSLGVVQMNNGCRIVHRVHEKLSRVQKSSWF